MSTKKVFNCGETVYYIEDYKIKNSKVKDVSYEVSTDNFKNSDEVFASKEELIESLGG